jgi:hypothetical protein
MAESNETLRTGRVECADLPGNLKADRALLFFAGARRDMRLVYAADVK